MSYRGGGGSTVIRGPGYYNLEANMMAAQSIANMIREIQQGQQRRGGQEFLGRLGQAQTPQQKQQVTRTPTQGPQGFLGKLLQPINPFGTAGGYSPTQQGHLTQLMDDQRRQSEDDRHANLQDMMQQRGEIRRSNLSEGVQARGETRRQKTRESDPIYQENLKAARTPRPDPYAGLTTEQKQQANEYKHGLRARPSAGDKPLEGWQQTPDEKAYNKFNEEMEKAEELATAYESDPKKNKEFKRRAEYFRKLAEATPHYQQNVKPQQDYDAAHQEYMGKMRYDDSVWNRGGRIETKDGSGEWQDADDAEVKRLLQESVDYLNLEVQAEIKKALSVNDPGRQRELLKNIIKGEEIEITEKTGHYAYGPGQTPPPKNRVDFDAIIKSLGETPQMDAYYEQYKHLYGL